MKNSLRIAVSLILYLTVALLGNLSEAQNLSGLPPASTTNIPPHILILNSYQKGYNWTDEQSDSMQTLLTERLPDATVDVVYMDWKRFPFPSTLEDLETQLRHKYSGKRVNAILTTDDAALTFALKFRKEFLSNAPVIFSGIWESSDAKLTGGQPGVTGVYETVDVENTIRLAMQINPKAKDIYIIHDNSETSIAMAADINVLLDKMGVDLKRHELAGMVFSDLKARLASSPKEGFALLASYARDPNGLILQPEIFARELGLVSSVPLYVLYHHMMGTGAIGGSLLDGKLQGRAAAELVVKILHGENPDSLPRINKKTVYSGVDFRQLSRYGIPVERIPKDVIPLNKPFSFFETYRLLVIGLSVVFVLLTSLIVVLIANNRIRKRASKELFEQKEQLRLMTDNLPDSYVYKYVKAPEGQPKFIYVSRGVESVHPGVTTEDVMENPLLLHTLLEPDQLPELFENEANSARNMTDFFMDLRFRRPDGSLQWLRTQSRPCKAENGQIVWYGSATDITSHKQVEESLSESEKNLVRLTNEQQIVLDCASVGICFLKNRKVQWANPAFDKMFGYVTGTTLNMDTAEWYIDEESYIATGEKAYSTIKTGAVYYQDVIMKRRDGSQFWCNLNGQAVTLGQPENGSIWILQDISGRKQIEEMAKQSEARLKTLVNIFQYQPDSIQDFLDNALNEAISLTASQIGYIYFYHEDRQEFELNSWSKDVMKECAVVNPMDIYHLDKTGIWGEAVRQRKPIIVNDFHTENPLRKGYPEGHVCPNKFMTVPVFYNNDIVALVGVANKADDYNEENVLQLTLLMDSVWKYVETRKGELALIQSQTRAQSYLDTVETMIVVLDGLGRITTINRRACQILGYEEAELVGQSWFSTCLPQPFGVEEVYPYFKMLIAGELEGSEYYENDVTAKDGTLRQIAWHNSTLRDDNGRITGTLSAGEDITERKQAEKALKNSEEKFSKAFRASPELITIASLHDGRYVDVNDVLLAITGFQRNEVIGHTSTELGFWITQEDRQNYIVELTRNGFLKNYEVQFRMRNGEVRSFLVSSEIIEIDNERCSLNFMLDQTDRIKSEKELEHTRLMLEAAFEQSPVPMVLVSLPDAVLRIVNTACRNILGILDEPSPAGMALTDFKPSYQDFDADGNLTLLAEAPLALALRGQSTINQERKIVTKNGTVHWSLVSANSICNTQGEIIAAYLVFPDITVRKKTSEEKIKLESQLHQVQKMESVGSLAGGVAHDFNNKLSVILGCTYLADAESDPAQLQAYLAEIRKAAEQSADLTRQLLAFARKQTIVPQVLNLNETVAGMLKMLNRLIGENIPLTWQPASDQCLIKFDPSQIDQILANLCVNARDSIADNGNITIETGISTIDVDYCTRNSYASPGEYVRLIVSDTGCGMDDETQSRIFEPFFTTKEAGKGTGLGLATVFGIVKQNSGFINVYSEPGVGTTFTIYLPRFMGAADLVDSGYTNIPSPQGLETVLLVEDELAILNMAATILTKQGYIVYKANTASEAIRLAKEHVGEINLLITDVIMPEMNGKELTQKLLSLHPQLKSIFMSGYTSDAIAQHGVLDEGVNFIQKPFSLPAFATKVRDVLDGK